MPYLSPSPSTTSMPPEEPVDDSSQTRPTHRRTRSATPTFSTEKGQGAFTPLAGIPRRQRQFEKRTHFQIAPDDDDEADTNVPEKAELSVTPPSSSPPKAEATPNEPRIEISGSSSPPETNVIPFPSSSEGPAESSLPFPSFAPPTSRSTSLSKSSSSPIVLSNGKTLKPSLKSSMSSPQISELPGQHLRSRSEPSTPMAPKTVHFPERKDNLESVIMFEKSARPRAISGHADDTETETEGYDSPANAAILAGNGNTYPFSPSPSSDQFGLEIDQAKSSTIPVREPSPFANVLLETLVFPRTKPPTLRGSILVKNVAFEKGVALRFTLDNWQTTSEVVCRHVCSLPALPSPFPPERISLGSPQLTWDRFSFLVRLEDVERKLAERTIYFAARFQAIGVGEWWDNNGGANYKVCFKRASSSAPLPTNSNKSPSPLRFSGDGPKKMFPGLDLRPSTLSLPSSDPSMPPLKLKKPFGMGSTSSPTKSSPAPPTTSHVSPVAAPPAPFSSPASPLHQRSVSTSSIGSSASTGSLRLSNYAAPPMSPILQRGGTSSPRRDSPPMMMGPILGGQPVSSPTHLAPTGPKTGSLSPNASRMNLSMNQNGSPAGSPNRTISTSSSVMPTPTTIGGPITPASPIPTSHLESNPDDRTPLANGFAGSRNNSNSSFPFDPTKDGSYAALIEKWCFHQSPPPGNGLGGGSLSTSPSADISTPGLDAGIKGSLQSFARPGTTTGPSRAGQFESSANGYGSAYGYTHHQHVLNNPLSLHP